jgi:hypothetical protein
VRRNLERLRDGGYIVTQKARYGLVVGVVNSRKIRPKNTNADRSDISGLESRPLESEHSDRSKVSGLSTKSERTGDSILIDNAVRQSNKTATACPVWAETGIDPQRLPGPFRKLAVESWANRNGESLFEFMGSVLDSCHVLKIPYPPAWVRRKAELAHLPKQQPERPYLEELPPCKKK